MSAKLPPNQGISMTNEDIDAQFAALMEGVELNTEVGVADVSTLTDQELASLMEKTRAELYERGEMLKPTTERARELHSLRAALVIESRERAYRADKEAGCD